MNYPSRIYVKVKQLSSNVIVFVLYDLQMQHCHPKSTNKILLWEIRNCITT